MHISAKLDYAVRALVALAAGGGGPLAGATIAQGESLPAKFLEGILAELRRAGLVASQRGADGGYRLTRAASEITLAEVFRAIDGPLAEVRGERPETLPYSGAAVHVQEVWIAVRASLRAVLEHTTLDDVASGCLPAPVRALSADPDAWLSHTPPIPEPRLPQGASALR